MTERLDPDPRDGHDWKTLMDLEREVHFLCDVPDPEDDEVNLGNLPKIEEDV